MTLNEQHIIDEQAAYWHIANREPLANEAHNEFERWLQKEEHRNAYDALLQIETLFQTLPQEMQNSLVQESTPQKRVFTAYFKPLAAAAVVIFACIGIFEAYAYSQFKRTHEIQTAYEAQEILLPDASKVRMDASTKLSITYYDTKREVFLTQGQATFEVTKNEKRPFIVKSPHLDVSVLGTYFSVSYLNDLTSIYVLNGSVQINERANNALLATLKKGESLVFDGKSAHLLFVKPFDTAKFALWTKGIVSFDKTPLMQALQSFGRYNDLAFVTSEFDPSLVYVTGSFQSKDVDKFLFALRNIYSFKIERHEKRIVISPKTEALK
jgi:transmembrane sensor